MRKSIYLITAIIISLILWNFSSQKQIVPEIIQPEEHSNISDFDCYNFKSKYFVTVRNCKNAVLKVSVYLPDDIYGKQTVRDINFSPAPKNIISENGNKIANFEIDNPDKQTLIEITGQVEVKTYDFESASQNPIADELSEYERKKYLSPEPFIESDDSNIVKVAEKLRDIDEVHTVNNIYTFVQRNMRYTNKKETIGAKGMLKKQKGKCTDYAMLMVALCRANGIPARIVSGRIIDDNSQNHTWVEVWFEKYGWVTFEPTIISNFKYDFKQSPYKYLTLGKDITSTIVVKLKVFSEDNRPRPDIVFALEEQAEFDPVK